ncbi:hypothetical protein GCM10027203_58530 [Nonomuraea fastidiosa]
MAEAACTGAGAVVAVAVRASTAAAAARLKRMVVSFARGKRFPKGRKESFMRWYGDVVALTQLRRRWESGLDLRRRSRRLLI